MSYTVTDVREIERQTQGGGVIRERKVYFTTGHGANGSIVVPLDAWDADKLAALLTEAAEDLDLPYTLG